MSSAIICINYRWLWTCPIIALRKVNSHKRLTSRGCHLFFFIENYWKKPIDKGSVDCDGMKKIKER
jgi:hypothetical protein